MIKTFEAFISDTDKDYEHEDIVVAICDTIYGIKKDHKYILVYPQPTWMNDTDICVKDIFNNQIFYDKKDNFITEMEYELGADTKKYNL